MEGGGESNTVIRKICPRTNQPASCIPGLQVQGGGFEWLRAILLAKQHRGDGRWMADGGNGTEPRNDLRTDGN